MPEAKRRVADSRGRLSLLTFFGEAKKVSSRRATPGQPTYAAPASDQADNNPYQQQQTSTAKNGKSASYKVASSYQKKSDSRAKNLLADLNSLAQKVRLEGVKFCAH